MRTIVLVSLIISGCANMGAEYVPLVDFERKGTDTYFEDLAECQDLARETAGANDGAISGAVIGGLLMAFLAPGGYRNDWAISGAAVGGAYGAVGASNNQREVVRRCLNNRGYSVLN